MFSITRYALVLFMSALSSALILIVSPSFKDPNLIWVSPIFRQAT